jgi:site-specific DNA-methyltransferase (adenine-specific)
VFYTKRPYYNPIKEKRDVDEKHKSRYNYDFNGDAKCEIYGGLINPRHRLEKLSYPKTIKRFKSVPNSKGRLHPSQKPVELLEYFIKTYTNEGDTVLDFTMGSASTGVACQNLNRDFIGIELDEKYFEIARNRLNNQQLKLI